MYLKKIVFSQRTFKSLTQLIEPKSKYIYIYEIALGICRQQSDFHSVSHMNDLQQQAEAATLSTPHNCFHVCSEAVPLTFTLLNCCHTILVNSTCFVKLLLFGTDAHISVWLHTANKCPQNPPSNSIVGTDGVFQCFFPRLIKTHKHTKATLLVHLSSAMMLTSCSSSQISLQKESNKKTSGRLRRRALLWGISWNVKPTEQTLKNFTREWNSRIVYDRLF